MFRTASGRRRLGGDQPAQRRPEEPALGRGGRHAAQRRLRPGACRAALDRDRGRVSRSWSATPTTARPSSGGSRPCPPATPRATRSASRATWPTPTRPSTRTTARASGPTGCPPSPTAPEPRRSATRCCGRPPARQWVDVPSLSMSPSCQRTWPTQRPARAELGGKGSAAGPLAAAGLPGAGRAYRSSAYRRSVPDGCRRRRGRGPMPADHRRPRSLRPTAQLGRRRSPCGPRRPPRTGRRVVRRAARDLPQRGRRG